MLKQALLLATGFLAGLSIAITAAPKAQPYIGGSVGISHLDGIGNRPAGSSHDGCASAGGSQNHEVGSLFAGYRTKYVGIEAGTGNLFHVKYGADCPWNLFTQDVKASDRYLRVNGYIPLSHGFELVPFVGRAVVKFTNLEVADYRAPYLSADHVTNLTTGKQVSTLFGVGVEKNFSGWFVRGEFQQVSKAAEDYWTARGWHNSVQTLSVSFGRYL